LKLKAKAFNPESASLSSASLTFKKHKALSKQIDYISNYSSSYKGYIGCLTDGVNATTDFRDGKWQGFFGDDSHGQFGFPT